MSHKNREMFHLKIFIVLIVHLLCYKSTEGIFGRDWAVWTKARRIVNLQLSDRKAIGMHPLNELKNFDIYTYGFAVLVRPLYGSISNMVDLNIIKGRGLLLRPDPLGNVDLQVAMPLREINTCGVVIGSPKTGLTDFISNITIYWKNKLEDSYDLIARPDNGKIFYEMNMKDGEQQRVLFFDGIPAGFLRIVMKSNSKKPINFTIASINKCIYSGKQIITDCGEKLEKNKKFKAQPYGVPISIKCPTNCIRTWPCWGYKVYSADSPICWAAKQNFGTWGNGYYTIYKIKKVFYFRNEASPLLNHGVYCRSSVTKYKGFTFDRKYYDFAVSEAKSLN